LSDCRPARAVIQADKPLVAGVKNCAGMEHEKIHALPEQHEEHPPMDTEQINQIGTQIEDLRAREAALRGYL
jgi:uncharacterized protein involved in copper resistance